MGNPRPRPALLHTKLEAIREYLRVSQPKMTELLKLLHVARVSEYECDMREPNLMVLVAYTRLGKVHMEWIVDDEISMDEFRERLGTVEPKPKPRKSIQTVSSPVTLIDGTR